ncbi:MAG: aldo/keto reductase [Actinomycetaceae bacterium]|nr:aldo/keto reductase [Actinomycetaceae bacterium]MDY6083218.1 aldo/keto reductase [Actinomycetaceae bacterium]
MRLRTVGDSGLVVSDIGLGTLTWGKDTDSDESQALLTIFADEGGTLIDTSPAFGSGAAEHQIGSLFTSAFNRSDFVICTRASFHFRDGHIATRTSGRGALYDSVAGSLARLNTSYIDVLCVEGDDLPAPDEETAEALASLVTRGLVRYIGLADFPAWRISAIDQLLQERRLPALTAVESEYSLLSRSIEKDILPMAHMRGLGVFATSALGRGVLSGQYIGTIPPTSRAASARLAEFVEPYLDDESSHIVQALVQAADGLDVPLTDIALGWALADPAISSALIGPRTAAQLATSLHRIDQLPTIVQEALDDVSIERRATDHTPPARLFSMFAS